MGFFRKVLNSTVGVAVRAPVAAVKVIDNLTDPDGDIFDDLGDTVDYVATGESDDPDYDGVADFNREGKRRG